MSGSHHATAVTALVSAALLSVTFMSGPTHSLQCGETFECCEECLNSDCYMNQLGECVKTPSSGDKLLCIQCLEDSDTEDPQFYFQEDCVTGCSDPNKCVCDGACWRCALSPNTDVTQFKCDFPLTAMVDNCKELSYVYPGDPPTSG